MDRPATDVARCASCGLPLDPGGLAGLCPSCLMNLGFKLTQASPTELAGAVDDVTHGLTTAAVAASAGSTSAPPTRIGPYRLVGQLGEGGMGVVYLAEQDEPIRRAVALKLIKTGLDTREVVSRFEAERQALALMDHPNIAHVYDAGSTVEGRPYFVMEYVPGMSITEYCEARALTTRQRVELFIDVCGAIQHAHQKGIIHRDLKPSNILVTEQDGRPLAKVIDFGIAKATDQERADRTVLTHRGRLVGTPEYMSPEQADSGPGDIDTRTDIYALGVILYELLVGELPFEPERLRQAAYTELLRILKEEEPPRPSARLTTVGGASRPTASRRRTTSPALASELRGDLDWITLKALEKDRGRRYASASEFAADLSRSLSNQPVNARPQSVGYRTLKFVRRNRLAVGSATAVLLAVLGGLAATSLMYFEAERARGEADAKRAEANAQRQDAIAQKQEAEAQSARADAARQEAEMLRATTDAALARTEEDLYFNNISLASREWIDGNTAHVDRLLAETPARLRNWEWRYLRSVAHMEIAAFRVNQGTLRGLAWSTDGRLVTLGLDRMIAVWDPESHRRVSAFAYPEEPEIHGAPLLSPDGRWVMVHGAARAVDIFDVAGRRVSTLTVPGKVFARSVFSPDGALLATSLIEPELQPGEPRPAVSPSVVQLWNVRTGAPLQRVEVDGGVSDLAFSADSLQLAVHARGGIEVFNCRTGDRLAAYNVGSSSTGATRLGAPDVSGYRYSHLGPLRSRDDLQAGETQSAIGALRGTQIDRAFDLIEIDGRVRWSWQGRDPADTVTAHRFTPDGRLLALAKSDRTIRVMDAATGSTYARLAGSDVAADWLAFTPDGRMLAMSGSDGLVRVWRLPAPPGMGSIGSPASTSAGGTASRGDLRAIAPDGNRVLLASRPVGYPSDLQAWDLTNSQKLLDWRWNTPVAEQLIPGSVVRTGPAFNPRNDQLLVPGMVYATQDDRTRGSYRIAVVRGKDGSMVGTLGPPAPPGVPILDAVEASRQNNLDYALAYKVAWSRDGSRVVVSHAGLHADRLGLASWNPACQTDIWDVASGRLRSVNTRAPADHLCEETILLSDNVRAIQVVRPLGRLTGGNVGTASLRLIDTVSGQILWRHPDGLTTLGPIFALSRNETRIAIVDVQRIVAVFDVETGARLCAIGPLPSVPRALAFHPDGTRIATYSQDGQVRLWDPATGRFLLSLPDAPGAASVETWTLPSATQLGVIPSVLTFSADGRFLRLTTATNPTTALRLERKTWDGAK